MNSSISAASTSGRLKFGSIGFRIKARDGFDRKRTCGEDNFVVIAMQTSVDGIEGKSKEVKVVIKDNGNGFYDAILEPGMYMASVSLSGIPIKGSPFQLAVMGQSRTLIRSYQSWSSLTFSSDGVLYAIDEKIGTVLTIQTLTDHISSKEWKNDSQVHPSQIAVGNAVVVCVTHTLPVSTVHVFRHDGASVGRWKTSAIVQYIAIDRGTNDVVAIIDSKCHVFDITGKYLRLLDCGRVALAVVVGSDGLVLIATENEVFEFARCGKFIGKWQVQFNPTRCCIAVADNGCVFVPDYDSNTVQMFKSRQRVGRVLFRNSPSGVACFRESLVISDRFSDRYQVVSVPFSLFQE